MYSGEFTVHKKLSLSCWCCSTDLKSTPRESRIDSKMHAGQFWSHILHFVFLRVIFFQSKKNFEPCHEQPGFLKKQFLFRGFRGTELSRCSQDYHGNRFFFFFLCRTHLHFHPKNLLELIKKKKKKSDKPFSQLHAHMWKSGVRSYSKSWSSSHTGQQVIAAWRPHIIGKQQPAPATIHSVLCVHICIIDGNCPK